MADVVTILVWIIAVTAALLVLGSALTYVPAMLLKRVQLRRLAQACQGKLALTYDDGPDPLLTPQLVELLQRYKVKATFFLLGFRAQRSPHMCDLLAKHQHELGCHAQHHLHDWKVWPWRSIANINDGYRNLGRWLSPSAAFRPPYGKLTTWTWLALRVRGARICWWTFDGADTHPQLPNPAAIVQQIITQNGGVVLLHSHDRGADRQRYVLDLTEQLLIAARAHGLHVCTMQTLHEPSRHCARSRSAQAHHSPRPIAHGTY